jgi:tetratricopeptide (TPR) repeat protein
MRILIISSLFLLVTTLSFAQGSKTDNAVLLDYYQNQQYLQALDYLKKTNPEPLADTKTLSKLAYAAQMAHMLPDAQSYYQRIYDLDTTNQAALFAIGDINLKRGNMQQAAQFYKRILLKDSTNFTVYTNLAAIAGRNKDTLAAVAYLQKANKLNANDIDVAVALGGFYIAQKHFDDALKILNKAAEGDPDNIFILLTMSGLYSKEKKWDKVIETGKKLIAADAGDDKTYYQMGVAYFNLKNYACGAESFASMSELSQTEYSCYYVAMCYKGLKDYKSAIQWLDKTLHMAISSNTASYYGEIADNNEKLNNNTKALQAYQKALQFDEGPAFYLALANIYEKRKDIANAKKYYKLGLQAYQKEAAYGQPMDYYTIANLYDQQLKDTANAIKFYKKYLESNPPQKQQNQFILYTQDRINHLQNKN